MSDDLESQRRAQRPDPNQRSMNGGGQIPQLTPAQYDLARYNDSIAEDIMREWDKGYFTAFSLKQKPIALEPLLAQGVLTIHKSTKHDGNYYKPTAITRAWCLTSLALADERRAAFKARTSGS